MAPVEVFVKLPLSGAVPEVMLAPICGSLSLRQIDCIRARYRDYRWNRWPSGPFIDVPWLTEPLEFGDEGVDLYFGLVLATSIYCLEYASQRRAIPGRR